MLALTDIAPPPAFVPGEDVGGEQDRVAMSILGVDNGRG